MTTTPTPAPAPISATSETTKVVPRTWKPITAGILAIIAGVIAIAAEIIYFTSGTYSIFVGMPFIESSATIGGGLLATGIIAIVGGIFALLRKIWWLALVGAIFSTFFTVWPVLIIAIISIILIALSRSEFQRVPR